MRNILLALILCVLPGSALGMSFSVPLLDLVGAIDFLPSVGGKTATFDVGQAFLAIERVSLELEADVFAREFEVCGPTGCATEYQLLGLFAQMDKEDSPILGTVFTNGLSFSEDFGAPRGSGVAIASFNNPRVGWDFLLDGQGSLTLHWNNIYSPYSLYPRNAIPPSGQIHRARLVIEGTPVPEASTAILVGVGLAGLAAATRAR